MNKCDPFDGLPRLMRLSSENIYRLMHLSRTADTWHEESLTDVLRGHLAGNEYKIEAPCPEHKTKRRCSWNHSSVREIVGGIELSSKHEESIIHGADILLVLTNGSPEHRADTDLDLRFFIQAKRVRNLDDWEGKDKRFKPDSDQLSKLKDAAHRFGADAYYLLYVQGDEAHFEFDTQCTVHTLPQDRAAVLVKASEVETYLNSEDKKCPLKLVERGMPLRCLADDCMGRKGATTVFERVAAHGQVAKVRDRPVVAEGSRNYRKVSPVVINPNGFRRVDSATPREHGDALIVILGGPKPNKEGVADGIGQQRRGSGWSPDYSPAELREAARQWWVVSAERARTVRFLVAVGGGKVQACYAITGGKQVPGGRYEFDVESLDEQPSLERRLIRSTRKKLRERKPGSQNPVTYVSV